jgi:uncharacterized protein (DUF2249 family)
MLALNADTKIASIIKQHPDALEAIISLSKSFEKLRNPLLRKLLAGRASISMAAKMAGCSEQQFYDKLMPLGFAYNETVIVNTIAPNEPPAFMATIKNAKIVELDVRQIILMGNDPLSLISEKIKLLAAGEILKLINSFEPVPLIKLLEKQGFEAYAHKINDNLVETYFFKLSTNETINNEPIKQDTNGWDTCYARFTNNISTLDVRNMEMPLPMITILEALDKLSDTEALFVYHKRIPVFLLPELAERNFDYRIKEIRDGEVQLLIFKA